MADKKTVQAPTNLFFLASLLFFISGGTGLVYQVVWFKRFSHVWGSTSLAFAAVGASFLFGLGLGAYLLGRFSDRVQMPLRWYGVSELLIGALALVIPFEIAALVDASVSIYASIPEQVLLRFLVQSCITLLVIGPPCVLMGGTLPLLIRQLTARDGSLDQATGWLYAINTFGAATGCYLAGFHIIPTLGLLWTNNLAAAINIGIGVVSLSASSSAARTMTTRQKSAAQSVESAPPIHWNWSLIGLYLAVTLSGAGALVLEMTWTRQLALILGGSTYAFTATLFVVLVGIALGSLVFHLGLRGVASSPLVPIVVVAVLVTTTVLGHLSLPWLAQAAGATSVREIRGEAFGNGPICVGLSALLEFLPAVAMGILFPLFVHLTHAGAARVGSAVGNIYAWNTLGSIVGASLTAVLLFPTIGTAGAIALAAGLYVVALLVVIPWNNMRAVAVGGVLALGGAGAVAAILMPTDPRFTNMGFYMYGQPKVPEGMDPDRGWLSLTEMLFFAEGASSNVLCNKTLNGDLNLRVNGKVDASNGGDMVTQLGLAYVPRVFKPDAKKVLVIGFGSGCTSGRSLLFPDTQVTCCEIEPAVYAASSQFASFNGKPQEKSRAWLEAENQKLPEDKRRTPAEIEREARFNIIFGDGRTAIQGGGEKYDIIISEPSNPWLAGVSNLFTKEFFRSAREHLNEGGVLAQWIQTYSFTLADYAMIVRTLRSEFPHYGVVMLMGGVDTVLLASNQPLLPKLQEIQQLQAVVDSNDAIKADLVNWFGGSDLRWLMMLNYTVGQEQLDQVVDAQPSQVLNTDLHLRLEFDAPLHLFQKIESNDTATVGLLRAADLRSAAARKWSAQMSDRLDVKPTSAEFNLAMGQYLLRQSTLPQLIGQLTKLGHLDRAAQYFQKVLDQEPNSVEAHRGLAQTLLVQQRRDDGLAQLKKLLAITPDDPGVHGQFAQESLTSKQFADATTHFREALRLHKKVSAEDASFLWANNLAWILATNPDDKLRNGAEAVRWAKAVCEADKYKQPTLLDTLAAAYAENGNFTEAVKYAEMASGVAQGQLAEVMKSRVKLYQSSQPLRE